MSSILWNSGKEETKLSVKFSWESLEILEGEGCSMFPQIGIIKYINILQSYNNTIFHIFVKSWIWWWEGEREAWKNNVMNRKEEGGRKM